MKGRQLRFGTCLLLGLLSGFPRIAECKDAELPVAWQADDIQLDGKRGDWPTDAMVYLAEQEVTVAISNNDNQLNLLLCHRSPEYARLIRMSGLTIWIDSEGRKKKKFRLKLTDGPTPEELAAVDPNHQKNAFGDLPDEMRERLARMQELNPPSFTCFEKDVIIEKLIPRDGSEGPSASFGIDNGFIVYELSIPLDSSGIRYYGIGAAPGQKISIGLIWNEMDKSKMGFDRPEGGMGEGGMPPGGGMGGGMPPGGGGMGGGMPGGGMGGGMPPGGGGMMMPGMSIPQKREVWIKVTLATKE